MKALLPLVLSALVCTLTFAQVPDSISYQGYLELDGSPVNEASATLTFRLHDDAESGSVLWTETQTGVRIGDGTFSVVLGSDQSLRTIAFTEPRWLTVAVGDHTSPELSPRTLLTAAPYALSLRGLRVVPGDAPDIGPSLVGGHARNSVAPGVSAATIAGGGNASTPNMVGADFGSVGGGLGNLANGLYATVAGGYANLVSSGVSYIGGGVSNQVAGDKSTISGGKDNAVTGESSAVGGGENNRVDADFGTVGGGGGDTAESGNRVTDNGGSVGGGAFNQAGDGVGTAVDARYATVSGGTHNVAAGGFSAVSGGRGNVSSGYESVVGGGSGNHATGGDATVGGGQMNRATGYFSSVPGGFFNEARGDYSFAGGYNAKAVHEGSFVWNGSMTDRWEYSDSLVSSAPSQFLIRAPGGVGIGTDSPAYPLTVSGVIHSTRGGFRFPDGTVQSTAGGAAGASWALDGNSGTTAGAHFLGTVDSQALEFKVDGQRALRIEPPNEEGATNILGGYSGNYATSGVEGATISGGGVLSAANLISGNFGFVGGGVGNQAGSSAAVSGGNENTASGFLSSVGGGENNVASGKSSTVPGGADNTAGGLHSLAAGQHAYVRTPAETGDSNGDEGTFVWADASTTANFVSSGPNQFLVRATGGVGLGTDAPAAQLHVREGGASRAALHAWSNVSGGLPGATFKAHNASSGSGIAAVMTTEGNDATVVVQQYGTGPLIKGYHSGKKFQVNGAGDLYAAGKIGVGTEGPTARIHVAGSGGAAGYFGGNVEVTGDVTIGGTIHNPSDLRLKKSIQPLGDGLEDVLRLRPVIYSMRDRSDGGRHFGFIAQEVAQVVPDVVRSPESLDGYYALSYIELIPLLVKAIQQQEQEIRALRAEVRDLKKR